MNNELNILIENHLDILQKTLASSENILTFAQAGKTDDLYLETENRNRLLNILESVQSKIHYLLEQVETVSLTKNTIEQIKQWQMKMNDFIEKINLIDQEIMGRLIDEKDSVGKEIAELYKKKQSFKGYNLKNVQR